MNIYIHTYINIHLYSTKYTHHTIYKQYQKFVIRKEMYTFIMHIIDQN